MVLKAYSFAEKKKVAIVGSTVMKQFALPNGRTVTMISGKSKKGNKVSVIVSNVQEKPCKSGKPRTPKGARCARK